jgi:hypothetical protein
MSYSLKDIGERLAALEARQLSNQTSNTNRLAALEASQSGGGGSGEFAGFLLSAPFFTLNYEWYVFYFVSAETTRAFTVSWSLFVTPGYRMYIKRNGTWYSFVGRITPYIGTELDVLNSGGITGGGTLQYYFTKN